MRLRIVVCLLLCGVALSPRPANGDPIVRGLFGWDPLDGGSPGAAFTLEVLDAGWPEGLLAFVDLRADAPLSLPGDPFCGSGDPPPFADFAFCAPNLDAWRQDTFPVGGVPTAAILYLGPAAGAFTASARLPGPGAVAFAYPAPSPPIPEPTALALLGVGLLLAAGVLRGRRHRHIGP